MKKLLFTLLAIAVAQGTYAQVSDKQLESMMTKRVLTCKDISLNAMHMIPALYRDQKFDTLESLVSYWNHSCGMNENIAAFTILYNIDKGTFTEELQNLYKNDGAGSRSANMQYYRDNIIWFLDKYYKNYMETESQSKLSYDEFQVRSSYLSFLQSMASRLSKRSLSTSTEYYLTAFYARPVANKLVRLGDSAYSGSILQDAYKRQSYYGGVSYETGMGMWIPNGNLANVGNHPYWFFSLGRTKNRMLFIAEFQARFGNTPGNHTVLDGDSLRTTKDYTSVYKGVKVGYMLLHGRSQEFSPRIGIASESMILLTYPSSAKTTACRSFNANVGFGYKVFLTHTRTPSAARDSYLNLEVNYNLLDYINKGGTDMTGHAFTIGLSYGGYIRSQNVVPRKR